MKVKEAQLQIVETIRGYFGLETKNVKSKGRWPDFDVKMAAPPLSTRSTCSYPLSKNAKKK